MAAFSTVNNYAILLDSSMHIEVKLCILHSPLMLGGGGVGVGLLLGSP